MSEVGQLARFALVGVVAAAIHIGTFEALRRLLGLGPSAGWLASFVIAATAAWLMNRSFTFRADSVNRTPGEWLSYLAVAGLGALAHFLVFLAVVAFMPFFARNPALAIVPGSLASLCVTYAGSSLFVFASARKSP
jgi:putative flippase GtrA